VTPENKDKEIERLRLLNAKLLATLDVLITGTRIMIDAGDKSLKQYKEQHKDRTH
jgi:hypothetical protein